MRTFEKCMNQFILLTFLAGIVSILISTISFDEVLSKSLAVADAAAFSLCRENKLPIIVFDLMTEGNIGRAVRGESIGTLVS